MIGTSRIFELIAGGALPICDANPFYKKYFGDKVLYINGNDEEKAKQIANHYHWALKNKNQVKQMVNVLQDYMKEHFCLTKQLEILYREHKSRRELVEKQYCALENQFRVNVIYIDDSKNNEDNFENLISSVINQNYPNINVIIVSNREDLDHIKSLDDSGISYEILKYNTDIHNIPGLILEDIQGKLPSSSNELFVILDRNERFFYDHISSLVRCFENDNDCQVVESNAVLYNINNVKDHDRLVMNNLKEFFISDKNFVFGSIMFKVLPLTLF